MYSAYNKYYEFINFEVNVELYVTFGVVRLDFFLIFQDKAVEQSAVPCVRWADVTSSVNLRVALVWRLQSTPLDLLVACLCLVHRFRVR